MKNASLLSSTSGLLEVAVPCQQSGDKGGRVTRSQTTPATDRRENGYLFSFPHIVQGATSCLQFCLQVHSLCLSFYYILIDFVYLYILVWVCMAGKWKSQGNLQESGFSFYRMGLGSLNWQQTAFPTKPSFQLSNICFPTKLC